jgi:hypothetical protein
MPIRTRDTSTLRRSFRLVVRTRARARAWSSIRRRRPTLRLRLRLRHRQLRHRWPRRALWARRRRRHRPRTLWSRRQRSPAAAPRLPAPASTVARLRLPRLHRLRLPRLHRLGFHGCTGSGFRGCTGSGGGYARAGDGSGNDPPAPDGYGTGSGAGSDGRGPCFAEAGDGHAECGAPCSVPSRRRALRLAHLSSPRRRSTRYSRDPAEAGSQCARRHGRGDGVRGPPAPAPRLQSRSGNPIDAVSRRDGGRRRGRARRPRCRSPARAPAGACATAGGGPRACCAIARRRVSWLAAIVPALALAGLPSAGAVGPPRYPFV